MTISSIEQFINTFGRHPVAVFLENPVFFTGHDFIFSAEFIDHVMLLAETFCQTFREDCI
ncbi:hypothetical protein [Desulforamulus hydrothermalis]|uniref:Uncharacterized protein n=1 Tax=Desulforamulus hydrothermalis Lam5 = DSM 18033 TaxID=1121428 RepID=K8EKI7_9FIRM|nr:hypothetical protein [Desulforamulus hydrothermalis]CCO09066.1 conserved hypothetical protein [Desulforamulus hydrothermalis Lam5 = DSM 18033]SHG78248.1 hypothetical protein SAMN02745177_00383 [Desulforamulus hydrothermalis Lam5 = DSM 18033]